MTLYTVTWGSKVELVLVESKQRPQNEFYLSPPSECVEHHLLVEISTKDSCLSESQFFFCLFFWSLRLTALRLDPDSGVMLAAVRGQHRHEASRGHRRVAGVMDMAELLEFVEFLEGETEMVRRKAGKVYCRQVCDTWSCRFLEG